MSSHTGTRSRIKFVPCQSVKAILLLLIMGTLPLLQSRPFENEMTVKRGMLNGEDQQVVHAMPIKGRAEHHRHAQVTSKRETQKESGNLFAQNMPSEEDSSLSVSATLSLSTTSSTDITFSSYLSTSTPLSRSTSSELIKKSSLSTESSSMSSYTSTSSSFSSSSSRATSSSSRTILISSSSISSWSLSAQATSTSSESIQQTIASIVGGSYSTQEPLLVRDPSLSLLTTFKKFLDQQEYADMFNTRILKAAGDMKMLSGILQEEMSQQTLNDRSGYVETQSEQSARPFLLTGKAKARTRKNCYMIRLGDSVDPERRSKVQQLLKAINGTIRHVYDTEGMRGVMVCFPQEELPLSLLRAINGLQYVERDQYVHTDQVQNEAPWQLSRINEAGLPFSDQYHFNLTGKGVNVYVIDSGVLMNHPEFGGRANIGYTVFPYPFPDDCAGHGTEVSSVIAGTNVGVAKLANITVAQVLDCEGQGENSAVLAALNWIIANHVKPAIINMSVGGPKSPAIDDAVRAAIAKGIPIVVAAGNSDVDACTLSPSGIKEAMVVGASTMDDKRASFSNYGMCVDIFAPGSHVIAASLPSQSIKNGFAFVSGTSLSAPLVTGIYALFLQLNPNATPAQLKESLLNVAARNKLEEGTLMGSPNLLAQVPTAENINSPLISFLPSGTLPIYGIPDSSDKGLEVTLVSISCALVGAALLIILFIVLCRYRRKRVRREEDQHPKTPISPFL